jgi:hypothetical protein
MNFAPTIKTVRIPSKIRITFVFSFTEDSVRNVI